MYLQDIWINDLQIKCAFDKVDYDHPRLYLNRVPDNNLIKIILLPDKPYRFGNQQGLSYIYKVVVIVQHGQP